MINKEVATTKPHLLLCRQQPKDLRQVIYPARKHVYILHGKSNNLTGL